MVRVAPSVAAVAAAHCFLLVVMLPSAMAQQALAPDDQARYVELDRRSLTTFTSTDLDAYLRLRRARMPEQRSPQEEVVAFALKAYRQPYALHAL
jgi:hypothetical protein